MTICHCSSCNRRDPWRLGPTAMGHGGGRLVLLNFETIAYFFQNDKKLKNKIL
jgi:hypothetical protein